MAVGRFITESVEIKINAEHVEPTITCRYCLPLFLSISSCFFLFFFYYFICIVADFYLTEMMSCFYPVSNANGSLGYGIRIEIEAVYRGGLSRRVDLRSKCNSTRNRSISYLPFFLSFPFILYMSVFAQDRVSH